MSIARGVLRGFIKEGLDQKDKRDEFYADLAVQAGIDVRKETNLFKKEEDNIEKRFNLIYAAHGPNPALYASYNGLTTSDAGTNLVIDTLNKDPAKKKEIEEFDFQGYDFNTARTQRVMKFKDQQKDVLNLLGKNQFPVPVAELAFKDLKAMDTGTQVTRPELQLPSLSSGATTDISPSDMRQFRSSAFTEFKAMEKDEFMKEFKDTFSEGYDKDKHGPSRDLYSFERYFNEFYLPGIIGDKSSKTMETQMQDMGATTTGATQETGATATQATFEGDLINFDTDPRYFSLNGKLYRVPEQFIKKNEAKSSEALKLYNERRGTNFTLPEFTVQSLPEMTKKAIASQQDKQPIDKNNPNVMAAQQAINVIRAENPNDPKIEDIKRDLRLILGVTNLDGLIS